VWILEDRVNSRALRDQHVACNGISTCAALKMPGLPVALGEAASQATNHCSAAYEYTARARVMLHTHTVLAVCSTA
jgi:hypothetical protein